eukprot:CAMPEP_0176370450 /NCGR_PEP_ID=MMETSP0126-20121128/23997_1 /TAXON_ID=141414 ORGANISM="Strombidinopsis acuminatum, Strain SPMC142" /NCGR_SAMPLE_ID=MMETSP0126 /ASSEMBLY_ACC=CAM_ASM_000229 /LENGTH=164 /DNA_ID=CAMNT_0017729493 /DNA_START=321 /DNA_END=815 /DNA_ORIENTATION=-
MPIVPGLLNQGGMPMPMTMPSVSQATKIPLPKNNYPGIDKSKLLAANGPLPWNDFFDSKEMIDGRIPVYYAGTEGHVFVCLHGCGLSAMSFAALAGKLKTDSIVAAFDYRGHGEHFCEDETNLSKEILIDESIRVIEHVSKKYPENTMVLVGHSMGGSIATFVC